MILARRSSELDARGVLRVSTSHCEREGSLLLAGLNPDEVAASVFGLGQQTFQSPLALALGRQFESLLYRNNAERLLEAYIATGRLNADAVISDLTRDVDRVARTLHFIEARLIGEHAPDVIIQGGLSLAAFGASESAIRPDILVAGHGERFYRPGEIKSYESREGYTSDDNIETSAAQASVALFALQDLHSSYNAMAFVDIILRKPSSLYPIIHELPADRDLHRLEVAAEGRTSSNESLAILRELANSAELELRTAILAIPTHYEPSCLQRCGFARSCRSEARANRDPRAVDGDARTLLPGTLDALENVTELPDSYEGRLLKRALDVIDEAIA